MVPSYQRKIVVGIILASVYIGQSVVLHTILSATFRSPHVCIIFSLIGLAVGYSIRVVWEYFRPYFSQSKPTRKRSKKRTSK